MARQNPLLPVPQDSTETLPPATAAGLTGGDLRRIRSSPAHSVSDNTRAAYSSAWRSFQAWTDALPASPQLVAAYLTHLVDDAASPWPPYASTRPPWRRSEAAALTWGCISAIPDVEATRTFSTQGGSGSDLRGNLQDLAASRGECRRC
jgi:hypothetical protein